MVPFSTKTGPFLVPVLKKIGPFLVLLVHLMDFFLVGPELDTLDAVGCGGMLSGTVSYSWARLIRLSDKVGHGRARVST